nr:MAG TPA: hypothetical protein [Caudoviricetes sp.]
MPVKKYHQKNICSKKEKDRKVTTYQSLDNPILTQAQMLI